jgi:TetR/AcrR family transcriptional repressor of nem operon
MRRSKEDTARTRADIVAAASRLFRKHGIAGVSVADVMASLGLTVGGFYRHFDSKDALVAEAITFASQTTNNPTASPQQVIDDYLSLAHVQHPEAGCPVAALCSEMSREGPLPRDAFTAAIKHLLAGIARAQPGREAQLKAAAAAVGGLMLARASGDPKLAAEILAAVRSQLREQVRPPTPGRRRGS